MGVGNPSYFITTKNKKNMKNAIIVPFDLNTARMIKNGEIEGSVLIGNIEIEFVYESKNCSGPYNLLFVKKDESGISAIYADTEGRTFFQQRSGIGSRGWSVFQERRYINKHAWEPIYI